MTYNLQDTTIHGLYYLARSKSKRNIVFWSIVTIFGVVYATLEIASEIKTTFRTSQFDVQYRTIDKGLEKYPELGIFFSDWTYTVDWRLAEELADEVNLSETEYALWFSGMHDHIWQWNNSLEDKFLLMKKFSSYGNWSETDKSNNSNVRQIW
uniref:Uncharacterized protein n=1 Tax=Romanomermis culicivorax TaxID=13658 RepID=A0A915I1G1_ROMCU